jgi:hypothetical protein
MNRRTFLLAATAPLLPKSPFPPEPKKVFVNQGVSCLVAGVNHFPKLVWTEMPPPIADYERKESPCLPA